MKQRGRMETCGNSHGNVTKLNTRKHQSGCPHTRERWGQVGQCYLMSASATRKWLQDDTHVPAGQELTWDEDQLT